MNRFKTWIIPGLVVIIALAGLVYFRGRLPEETTIKQPTIKVEVEETKPKGFAKPSEPTVQKKAEEDAKAMVNALGSGSLSDCAKITWNEELRKQCEDNLNYNSILKSGNASQCDIINDETLKIRCYDKMYMSSAVDQKDVKLCGKIVDAVLKQMCLDQVHMLLARFSESVEDCSSINSEILRKQCANNFYLKSSAKTMNVEGCNNISDPVLVAQCKKTVTRNISAVEQSKKAAENATTVKTLTSILDLCDNLSEAKATLCKDSVYPQLAFDKKDISYCSKVSDPVKASECTRDQGDKINTYYLRQSLALHDKTVCDQISDDELKTLCKNS